MKNTPNKNLIQKDVWGPDLHKDYQAMSKDGYELKTIVSLGSHERYMGDTGNNWTGFEPYYRTQDKYQVTFQKKLTISRRNGAILMTEIWDSDLQTALQEYLSKGYDSKHITSLGLQLRYLAAESKPSEPTFRNETKFLVVFERRRKPKSRKPNGL